MKFPKSIVERDEHYDKIFELINDPTCLIFLDTNILATCFRLYDSARMEFFNWIDPIIAAKRIKVPVWVLHEYSKRFMRGKVDEYLSTGKKLKAISNDFREVVHHLKMHVSDKGYKSIQYADQKAYHDDLDDILRKLNTLTGVAANNSQDYILKVHGEIQKRFSNAVIGSDIFTIIEQVAQDGPQRFANQLPPGYKDGHKEFNATGDLVIWYELLEYAAANKTQKVILLSNDAKVDWAYRPNLINYPGLAKPVANNQISLIDTRLVYEFNKATGSDEIFLLSLEELTTLLLKKGNTSLYELAKALQVEHTPKPSEELVNTQMDFDEFLKTLQIDHISFKESLKIVPGEVVSIAAERAKPSVADGEVKAEKIVVPVQPDNGYSAEALEDKRYQIFVRPEIGDVITGLRSLNWHVQNPAIASLRTMPQSAFLPAAGFSNDLFVLGRNIYQSASGGSFAAQQFIADLKNNSLDLSGFVKKHIVSGMFFEIYFDAQGAFRKHKLKSGLLDAVFELQTLPDFKDAVKFIHGRLEPYVDFLLVRPNTVAEKVDLTVTHEFYGGHWLWDDVRKITSIKFNGEELLKETTEEFYEDVFNIGSFARRFSSSLGVPTQQLKIILDPTEYKEDLFFIKDHRKVLKG